MYIYSLVTAQEQVMHDFAHIGIKSRNHALPVLVLDVQLLGTVYFADIMKHFIADDENYLLIMEL